MATIPLARGAAVVLFAALALLAGSVLAQSLPPELPLRRAGEAAADGGLWGPVVGLLGIAVGAAAYVGWRRGWLPGRRGGARRIDRVLNRVSSHALTPQASVHVVQWNGEEYLVGCTSQQVTLLARRAGGAGEETQS
jgi:membrane protein DedA with SNARE-associated domain